MDEPTVGIDPQSRNHILESILKLKEKEATIIYTTHYMEEVEEIADRIIIIDNGSIVAEGSKEELKESIKDERIYNIYADNIENLSGNIFFKIEGVKKVDIQKNCICITTLNTIENLDKIILFMINSGCKIKNINTSMPSLETVFLNLTGKKLRD